MFVYLLLVFAILFMFIVKDKVTSKSNKMIYIFLCIVIIVLVGFRSVSVGSDSLEYRRIFLDTSNSTLGEILVDNSRFEKGFLIYMKLLSLVTTDYHFFFIVSAIIGLVPIFVVVYKYSRNYYFSLVMFVLLRFMFEHMNIMRQSIAGGILFIALYFMIRKKRLLSLIFILIAASFHITAIVFIFLLLASIMKFTVNKKNVVRWIVFSFVMYFVSDILLTVVFKVMPQFSHYSTSLYFQGNNLGNYISAFICFAFISILFLYNAFPKKYQYRISYTGIAIKNEYTITRIAVISMLFSLVLFVLSCRASLIDRIASYFYVLSIIYVPNIIEKYSKKDKAKASIYLVYTSALVSYFVITLVFRPEWNYVVPYVFWR